MPTKLRRITLNVSPEFDDTVGRISELTKQSKAAVLMDILGPAKPFLDEVANLLAGAVALKSEPAAQFAENMERLRAQMLGPDAHAISPRASCLLIDLMQELRACGVDAPDLSPRPLRSVAVSGVGGY